MEMHFFAPDSVGYLLVTLNDILVNRDLFAHHGPLGDIDFLATQRNFDLSFLKSVGWHRASVVTSHSMSLDVYRLFAQRHVD
jgi:hypothetical protein